MLHSARIRYNIVHYENYNVDMLVKKEQEIIFDPQLA